MWQECEKMMRRKMPREPSKRTIWGLMIIFYVSAVGAFILCGYYFYHTIAPGFAGIILVMMILLHYIMWHSKYHSEEQSGINRTEVVKQ